MTQKAQTGFATRSTSRPRSQPSQLHDSNCICWQLLKTVQNNPFKENTEGGQIKSLQPFFRLVAFLFSSVNTTVF